MERNRYGKGCWYKTVTYYCPVCWHEKTYRVRRWGPKPRITYEWIADYDWCEL